MQRTGRQATQFNCLVTKCCIPIVVYFIYQLSVAVSFFLLSIEMNSHGETICNSPFYHIDLKPLYTPRYGMSSIKYPSLVQHSPHPTRVRHLQGLSSHRICVVDTDESSNNKKYSLLFPPNQYNDAKLKSHSNKYNCACGFDTHFSAAAHPSLDTILSLNYFTGLQNMSLNTKPIYNMKRLEHLDGWERELKNLTISTLTPLLIDTSKKHERPLTVRSSREEIASPMKRLYSSSGRILPLISKSRPQTSQNRKPSSRLSSSRSVDMENVSRDIELDLQVFHILGGVLQTTENEVIKTWLLSSTEREKALMIDILRSALLDKEEMNIFVRDPDPYNQNQIVYTPNKNYNPRLPAVPENSNSEKIDCLSVHNDPPLKVEAPQSRPPTSSTFKPSNKGPVSRPPTREESTWVPSESIVVN